MSFQEHSFFLKVQGLKNSAKELLSLAQPYMVWRGDGSWQRQEEEQSYMLKCIQLLVCILCCAKAGKLGNEITSGVSLLSWAMLMCTGESWGEKFRNLKCGDVSLGRIDIKILIECSSFKDKKAFYLCKLQLMWLDFFCLFVSCQ